MSDSSSASSPNQIAAENVDSGTPESNEVPAIYQISRAFGLVICLPCAVVLLLGALIPGDTVDASITGKAVNTFTVKGRTHNAYVLRHEQGEVEVSERLHSIARQGDSLRLRTALISLGEADINQRAKLIRNGKTVHTESPSILLIGCLVLILLTPLYGFLPYGVWKNQRRVKLWLVLIPTGTTLLLLYVAMF